MGDVKAKVEEGPQKPVVGPHGLGTRNDRGGNLIKCWQLHRISVEHDVPETGI